MVFTVSDGTKTVFSENVVYSASTTGIEVDVDGACKTATCLVQQQRNIFLGFRNDAAHGYAHGGSGDYSNPLYAEDSAQAYKNPGSSFDHNTTFHPKSDWKCPATGLHERNAFCGDPHLADETWHNYGYGDTRPTQPIPEKAFETDRVGGRSGPVLWASVGLLMLAGGGAFGWRKRARPTL